MNPDEMVDRFDKIVIKTPRWRRILGAPIFFAAVVWQNTNKNPLRHRIQMAWVFTKYYCRRVR